LIEHYRGFGGKKDKLVAQRWEWDQSEAYRS